MTKSLTKWGHCHSWSGFFKYLLTSSSLVPTHFHGIKESNQDWWNHFRSLHFLNPKPKSRTKLQCIWNHSNWIAKLHQPRFILGCENMIRIAMMIQFLQNQNIIIIINNNNNNGCYHHPCIVIESKIHSIELVHLNNWLSWKPIEDLSSRVFWNKRSFKRFQ